MSEFQKTLLDVQCAFPVSDAALKSVRTRDHRSLEQKRNLGQRKAQATS